MEISLHENINAGSAYMQSIPGMRQGTQPDTVRRSLEVVFREFMEASANGMEVLESILQSYYDSTSRIIKNMVMTPDERRMMEERRERILSLREALKERKIDEQNARLELERIMSEESVLELESAISGQIV